MPEASILGLYNALPQRIILQHFVLLFIEFYFLRKMKLLKSTPTLEGQI